MLNQSKFVDVAVEFPTLHLYRYFVPEDLIGKVTIGSRVLVPFGKREITGYVENESCENDMELAEIKAISAVIDECPLLSDSLIKLCKWVSDYYISPLGFVYRAAYPAGTNRESRTEVNINPEEQLNCMKFSYREQSILEIIKSEGKTTVSLLKNKHGFEDAYSLISRLKAKKIIITGKKVSSPRAILKYESSIHLNYESRYFTDKLSEIKLTNKQLLLIKLLQESGELLVKEACKKCGIGNASVKKLEQKGIIEIIKKRIYRSPQSHLDFEAKSSYKLLPAQESALQKITEAVSHGLHKVFLLHGITGSGKTEIYIRSIKNALDCGKTALVLVPEISLTPQIIARINAHFPDKVAVLHSSLSAGERFDEWFRVYEGMANIVVGTRSAVFAPLKNIGLIVVDEEHDTSYKQEEPPCYNGRDVAVKRGKIESCPVVLGSASPSVESFQKSKLREYSYLNLPERATGLSLPEVQIIDMRKKAEGLISIELENNIRTAVAKKEQVILYLNRRGFFRTYHCSKCGVSINCPNCSVSLTHHLSENNLKCHYCDFSKRIPAKCDACGESSMKGMGVGVQQVEEYLKNKFPDLRIQRFDRDSTQKKNSFKNILKSFQTGEIDILIGTQMLSKGHDYPRVTLTGVILADQEINYPDFRSSERAFQALLQVSGRSGRKELPGKSLIQSYKPDHYVLHSLLEHDYCKFFYKEITFREKLCYPPFSKLINIIFRGKNKEITKKSANIFYKILKQIASGKDVEIIGPAEPLRWKVRGKYRWQLIVKSKDEQTGIDIVKKALNDVYKGVQNTSMTIDVDPVNLS